MSALVGDLIGVLAQTISIYTLVLLVRVLLSWFPNLDWGNPVLSTVSAVTDPYLNAFRGLIPPLGGLDLSAILAFLALQLIQTLLEQSRGFFYPSFYLASATACSRGSKSSNSPARVRTGEANPRAFTFEKVKGPGVPAGMARRRAKFESPGGTSPIEPTRERFCNTGSPLASRI